MWSLLERDFLGFVQRGRFGGVARVSLWWRRGIGSVGGPGVEALGTVCSMLVDSGLGPTRSE
jgi:hypothetical protein